MARVARRLEVKSLDIANPPEQKTAHFLNALTELSRQHGVGITGQPILFTMETGPESDYERTYRIDRDSRLSFD